MVVASARSAGFAAGRPAIRLGRGADGRASKAHQTRRPCRQIQGQPETDHLAAQEQRSPPQKRRDRSRLCKRRRGSFCRRVNALFGTAGSAPRGAGLRPSGRGVSGLRCRPERFHGPRRIRHRSRGTSLSRDGGTPPVTQFRQQRPVAAAMDRSDSCDRRLHRRTIAVWRLAIRREIGTVMQQRHCDAHAQSCSACAPAVGGPGSRSAPGQAPHHTTRASAEHGSRALKDNGALGTDPAAAVEKSAGARPVLRHGLPARWSS